MNNSTVTYTGTLASGVLLGAGQSPEPAKAPKALLATRAVQMKEGWVGQVIVAESIIWESAPQDSADEAEQEATRRVIKRITKVLS